jgi:hypothetical protein
MTPQENAKKLYRDAYMRWCYELSHEKNVLTAKDISLYICEQVIKSREQDKRFDDILYSSSEYWTSHPMYLSYWLEVKKTLNENTHNQLMEQENYVE